MLRSKKTFRKDRAGINEYLLFSLFIMSNIIVHIILQVPYNVFFHVHLYKLRPCVIAFFKRSSGSATILTGYHLSFLYLLVFYQVGKKASGIAGLPGGLRNLLT